MTVPAPPGRWFGEHFHSLANLRTLQLQIVEWYRPLREREHDVEIVRPSAGGQAGASVVIELGWDQRQTQQPGRLCAKASADDVWIVINHGHAPQTLHFSQPMKDLIARQGGASLDIHDLSVLVLNHAPTE